MDIRFQKTKLSRFEINEYLKRRYKNYLTVVANHGDAVEYIESKKDDRCINIFAIDNKNKEAAILNRFYLLFEEGEFYGLVNYCFEKYKPSKVSIGPILNDIMKITPPHLPIIEFVTNNDNIAHLPDTFVDFIASLGKMTKKHSKYYIGRIKRDFPSVEYEYQESGDVRKDSFDTVCELSRSRMKFKNKVYSSNADNDTRLFNRITEDNGFVSLVKIDERIVAGCAGFIFDEHLYLCKIAHDVELNNYNVGQVALLKLIEWCIEVKKVKEFHYLWGKNIDYKDRFGGNTYPLYNYYIYPYRSPLYYKDYFNLKYKGLLNEIKDKIRKHQALMKWYHRFTYRNENYT